MKRFFFLFMLMIMVSFVNAQMLSKETGEIYSSNTRIQQTTKPIIPGEKFIVDQTQFIKIENATPQSGNSCQLEKGGLMSYLMKFDSTNALMVYENSLGTFTGCKTGASFLLNIDSLFVRKKYLNSLNINIKRRLIKRNMQRN